MMRPNSALAPIDVGEVLPESRFGIVGVGHGSYSACSDQKSVETLSADYLAGHFLK
jgi:hypothetical protein